MVRQRTCKIFVSYNSADQKFALKLAEELEKLGADVWFDRWKVRPGDSLTESISQAIEKANIFVFIMSPASLSAPWPKNELRAALSLRLSKRGFRVVPIAREKSQIPLFLRDYRRLHAPKGIRVSTIVIEFATLIAELGFFVSGIPNLVREEKRFFGVFTAHKVKFEMRLTGVRGRQTVVTERFTIIPRKSPVVINRRIACAGRISGLQVHPGELVAKRVLPGTTQVAMRFAHIYPNKPLEFTLTYSMYDSFRNDEEFWFYIFQTVIRKFEAIIEFESPVKFCKAYRYQGEVETTAYTMSRHRKKSGAVFTLTLDKPPYLEGVMFRWRWTH